MLHKIGTLRETESLPCTLPEAVRNEILQSTAILDREYGADRDYFQVGGYTLLAENSEDLSHVETIINLRQHPPEWVSQIDGFVSALYVLNDDYSLLLLMPLSIAPDAIRNEMEVNPQ